MPETPFEKFGRWGRRTLGSLGVGREADADASGLSAELALALEEILSGELEAVQQGCHLWEQALSDPEATAVAREEMPGGVNRCRRVTLDNGAVAVFKPDGEDPALTPRERAAYLVDRWMGHLGRILPTVIRQLDGKRGVVLPFVPQASPAYSDARAAYVLRDPRSGAYRRLSILDLVLGNRDRHAGNWLMSAGGQVIPIDHGLAFPDANGNQWYRAYDFHRNVPLEGDAAALNSLLDGEEQVRGELAPLVGEPAVGALLERCRTALKLGRTYPWHSLSPRAERALFLEKTDLDDTRPEHRLQLSEPQHYEDLLEHVEVHRYYLGRERQAEVPLPEAAASWYDHVYLPVIEGVHEGGLLKEFPRRTVTDLYRWVLYHREELARRTGERPADAAVAADLAERYSERPLVGLIKSLVRSIRAALQAASETAEPPEG